MINLFIKLAPSRKPCSIYFYTSSYQALTLLQVYLSRLASAKLQLLRKCDINFQAMHVILMARHLNDILEGPSDLYKISTRFGGVMCTLAGLGVCIVYFV